MADAPWRNRIVGYGEVPPDSILAHPSNWRVHPTKQQDALAGVLATIGLIQNIIINKRTGPEWPAGDRDVETLLDGHARVGLALSQDQPTVPVTYVDLSPADEALALATLDPLSAMAVPDTAKLDELLREVQSPDGAVQQMLAELAASAGLYRDGAATEDTEDGDGKSDSHAAQLCCPACGHTWSV